MRDLKIRVHLCQSVATTSHSWFRQTVVSYQYRAPANQSTLLCVFAPWRLCVENLSTPTLPPTHRATYPFTSFQPTEVVSCAARRLPLSPSPLAASLCHAAADTSSLVFQFTICILHFAIRNLQCSSFLSVASPSAS
jgi:hypothetical protein